MKDSNIVMEPSQSHSDFMRSPNRRVDSDLAARQFAFKRKKDNNTFSNSVKTYECDKCKKTTFNRTSFIRPFKSHSAKSPIACGESQNNNSSKKHLETHTLDDKPFACNICEKRFTSNSDLIKHNRKHTNEKPFECDLCKKAFSQEGNLNRHYRIHTNEKPFVCNKCGMRFVQKSDLVNHERIHTGEKPFKCDMCGKRFNRKSYLADHHRIHTGEKPYECEVCKKRFS